MLESASIVNIFFLFDFVTFIDNLLIPIFGESNIIIIAKKV